MGRSDRRLRLLVAAFGDPGHAFPAIALARELRRRGHEVLVETWERWREAVEGEGLALHRRRRSTRCIRRRGRTRRMGRRRRPRPGRWRG